MNLVHQSSIHVNVHDVRVDMQDVRVDVQDVGNMVQGVDDKLDQANRSLLSTLIVIPRAHVLVPLCSNMRIC